MKAWLSARRIKSGMEEEFGRRWADRGNPDGMTAAYLLRDEEDPQETISLSLWESPRKLSEYRAGGTAQRRDDALSDIAEPAQWSRGFDAYEPGELMARHRRRLLFLPFTAGAAGLGTIVWLRRQRGRDQSVVTRGKGVVRQGTRHRWILATPLLLSPLGAGAYFLIRRLRGHGGEPRLPVV